MSVAKSSTTTASNIPAAITTDIDIFPTDAIPNTDPSGYIYDGQTVLMINSTLNQNSNLVKAQYFDPVNGSAGRYGNSGFSDWSFNLVPNNYLNGVMSSSSLLSEETNLYNNLQPFNNSLATYSLDITDGSTTTAGSTSGIPGTSYETCFFSLTSNPYVTQEGTFTNGTYPNATQTGVNIRGTGGAFNTELVLFRSCRFLTTGYGIYSNSDHNNVTFDDCSFYQLFSCLVILLQRHR
jgi:hypothetical protein